MSSVIRSTWFKFLPILALALFTVQCGDDSEVIIQDHCPGLDGFEGGDYIFMVNVGDIVDGCAQGAFNGLIDPGPYPAVTLPALADLPLDITIDLPFVGPVTGGLSSDGNTLRLTVDDPIDVVGIEVPIIGQVDVTVRVSGTLCPISATRVDAAFAVSVESIDPPLIPTPCTIGVPATGTTPPM